VQDEQEHIIAYASRTLTKPEKNYETTRKELLAVFYGLKQFKQYLLGAPFITRTDYSALGWLRRTPKPLPQLARWLTFFEQFDYTIVHWPGTKHGNVDALSRRRAATEDDHVESATLTNRAVHAPSDAGAPAGYHQRPNRAGAGAHTTAAGAVTSAGNECHNYAITAEDEHEEDMSDGEAPATFVHPLAWENLATAQLADEDIGPIVTLRLERDDKPAVEELQTKIYWSQWDRLLVRQGVVYHLFAGKDGRQDALHLLVLQSLREEAIRYSHTGMAGGHLGTKKTIDQVQPRFCWTSWRGDTARYCHRCTECSSYHRENYHALCRYSRSSPVRRSSVSRST